MLRQYNVPVIRVGKSLRSVAEELGGGTLAAQLPPAPGAERRALAAATAPAAAPPDPVPSGVAPDDRETAAQQLADAAAGAGRDAVWSLIQMAKARRLEDEQVCFGGVWMTLKDALTDAWNLASDGES